MELWRISNYPDLAGVGGVRAAGRWHSRGRPIVYLADHASSALLEMLVHMDRDLLPATYQLLRVIVPDGIVPEIVPIGHLPADWRLLTATTREIGDAWLDRGATALLQVPSVITPNACNYLLNPAHPDAATIVVADIIKAPFDPRLVGE